MATPRKNDMKKKRAKNIKGALKGKKSVFSAMNDLAKKLKKNKKTKKK